MNQLCNTKCSVLAKLNVVYRCIGGGLKGQQRCNFTLSLRSYCQHKPPPTDKETKAQVDQNDLEKSPSGYAKQDYANPILRTFGIISGDVRNFLGLARDAPVNTSKSSSARQVSDPNNSSSSSLARHKREDIWPAHCDVLIVGGGIMGTSIAYHLKEKALQGLNVVVVEQDKSYKQASTVLSLGGIRQQFSIPENILLSQYGAEFLRHAHRWLSLEGQDPPDVQFKPHGYLTLASEKGLQKLHNNFQLQREMGCHMELLSGHHLKDRFPWLNTDGAEAGVLGLQGEGWFDPWALLMSLKQKAVSLGVEYVEGKVTGMEGETLDDMVLEGKARANVKNLRHAKVQLSNGETRDIKFAIVVVAAGAWTGQMARMVGIGEGHDIMSVPVPVEPRKRYVYCFHAPEGPGLDAPLTIDPNGTYFRREGLRGLYLCGQSPPPDQEPDTQDLHVDEDFFYKVVWPSLANRIPSFNEIKLHSSWAGFYDYNTFDQNAIVGLHPMVSNMYLVTGFSGHGIQQALGVGRAIMEAILEGEYKTINLERFAFERVLIDDPLYEENII
ncbi:hypothetical protein Pcinc_015340 [Petrolisthes cinctipes]|uniref:FAD-dependent oxidoreductase domain-containing protein 1 n=1 Tax=Petrolisthes cinctipes TaxID=88211 RepID=A0AAE1FT73_PETCI|nr:hypothetical protein Pcinc_015340 [Petrolisthes cinctipes]